MNVFYRPDCSWTVQATASLATSTADQHHGSSGYDMYIGEYCQQIVAYPQHPSDPPQSAGRDTPQRSSSGKTSAQQAKKRGIFPKPATNILRAWLFQHLT
ncbi:hypothetical protein TELCIR_26063, partial [Teladorsagia circumcincta]